MEREEEVEFKIELGRCQAESEKWEWVDGAKG